MGGRVANWGFSLLSLRLFWCGRRYHCNELHFKNQRGIGRYKSLNTNFTVSQLVWTLDLYFHPYFNLTDCLLPARNNLAFSKIKLEGLLPCVWWVKNLVIVLNPRFIVHINLWHWFWVRVLLFLGDIRDHWDLEHILFHFFVDTMVIIDCCYETQQNK